MMVHGLLVVKKIAKKSDFFLTQASNCAIIIPYFDTQEP